MATTKAISAASAVSSKAPSRIARTPKQAHKSNRDERESPETEAAILSPEQRLILGEEVRDTPHYVLRCTSGYLSGAGLRKATKKLSEAVVYSSYRNASLDAEFYSSQAASERPFVVERLVVECNGIATGCEPTLAYVGSDRSIYSLEATKWSGTRHNSALAECAEIEERRGKIIIGHVNALAQTQMYSQFVDEYHASLGIPKGLSLDWHLSLFGARIFCAGVIGSRHENGRRDALGELLLDSPGSGLRHDSAFAEAAESEIDEANSDIVCDHLTMLTSSPMFKLLVDSYYADLAKPEALESDWYLAQFAARLFYAGVIAGRRENCQRASSGHLIMDNPCTHEPK